jgi:excinuclease ABC subunit C
VRIDGKAARLRSEVRRQCPRRAGVYGMINAHGDLIYVGKAKGLRARLLSYFRPKSRDPRAGKILRQARAILWEPAASEFAALLRELELIRRWRPRFNIHGHPLRRNVTFLCLGRAPAPYAFLSRRPPAKLIARFGPIPAGLRAKDAVRRLNDLFGLRDCPQPQDMIFADDGELFEEPPSAGCLRLEIGTCLGPCAAACSRRDYHTGVRAARKFLEARDDTPLRKLEEEMATAAASQAFERAAFLRDRVQPLRWLLDKLAQLHKVRTEYSFVYPVTGGGGEVLWYAIHGGRTIAVGVPPRTADDARATAKMIEAVYDGPGVDQRALESYEHIDGMLIVASWFRRFPKERGKVLSPEEALRRCRG